MNPETIIRIFKESGALLEGHFIYASGRHGRQFLQAARVFQYPDHGESFGQGLAAPYQDKGIDLVVGPATGGIVIAYETARQLKCRAAYTEKEGDGSMALKRGFKLSPGEKVLVVEDIVTTGGSVQKTIDHLRARGAEIAGVAVLIDRSSGMASFDCPFTPLAVLPMESWPGDELPEDLAALDPMDPDDIIL